MTKCVRARHAARALRSIVFCPGWIHVADRVARAATASGQRVWWDWDWDMTFVQRGAVWCGVTRRVQARMQVAGRAVM